MSELMTPIPFRELMTWITTEYQREGTVFGVHRPYRAGVKKLPIFGETIETPFGPAAGPNTQLAQNIIAAYFAGARFFELKTVQKMDGADLAACINRPCILANDECYNCEWSTELYVQQAFEEYVKAWCALKLMAKVYGLGDPNGFVFNMSVGYDLAGIHGEKIDTFLNGMVDASKTPIFQECIAVLKEFFPGESDYIDAITPHVSGSVTVSTLHGCPPDEIERIASYLLEKKHLHTFVKCNPTLLGYETARTILDSMGYDYIAFDDHHFKEDLQYSDAVPMFHRLQALADREGLEFGLKLSNTFPVDVKAGELPSEEMYMAGKSLFPLTTTMAARIAREFGGKLRLSYAGGADAFNIDKLFACGIWPITMATTELKPGGYQRFTQIGDKLDQLDFKPFTGVDVGAIEALSLAARSDKYHVKAIKPLPRRKLYEKVPLVDCFTAPCKGGCPIGQDIPEYIELCRKGEYASALRLITEKNPLPFITGTICAHNCMTKCTRNFYDKPVNIRATKLVAAEKGYDEYVSKLRAPVPVPDSRRVAVIGGGPAGMAAAYFCGRAGIPVTIFEREGCLGGVVRQVIPAWRISDDAIDRDVALMFKMGVDVKLNTEAPSVAELKAMGYTHIFFAVGAWKAGKLDIPGNVVPVIQWLKDMKAGREVPLGHVAVVGRRQHRHGRRPGRPAGGGEVLHPGVPPDEEVYARRRGGAGAGHRRRRGVSGAGGPRGAEGRQAHLREDEAGRPGREGPPEARPHRRDGGNPLRHGHLRRGREGGQRDLHQQRHRGGRQGRARLQDQHRGCLRGRRRHAWSRHRGGRHCRRPVVRQRRHRRGPQGPYSRQGCGHPGGGHRQEGHPLRERQVRGRPLPDL